MTTAEYEELVYALLARGLRRALDFDPLVAIDGRVLPVAADELASAAVRAATILQQYYAKARARAGRFADV